MTQEDKNLLLKDLCARLPYGVKCVFYSKDGYIPSTIIKIDIDNELVSHKPDGQSLVYVYPVEEIISYLRPMSSMTEEEWKEYNQTIGKSFSFTDEVDWLNAHHFDYRGLIEKGLALEVTEENNPYK